MGSFSTKSNTVLTSSTIAYASGYKSHLSERLIIITFHL